MRKTKNKSKMLNIQSMRQSTGGFATSILSKGTLSTGSSSSSSSSDPFTVPSNQRSSKRNRSQRKNHQVVDQNKTLKSELQIKGDIKNVLTDNQQVAMQVTNKKMGNEKTKGGANNSNNVSIDYCDKNMPIEAENLGKLLDDATADLINNQELTDKGSMSNQPRRRPLAKISVTNEEFDNDNNNLKGESDRGQQNDENQASDLKNLSSGESSSNKETESELTENKEGEFKTQLVWTNIILFVILHSCFPISVYMFVTQRPIYTTIYSFVLVYASGLGITGGAHRLWSHKSYKAGFFVETLLMILQTMAGQNSIYTWSRDHRVHHKFSETNADPHNIKRGFFFAHMGWLCCKKHPDVKEKGKLIDMSDLEANPIVMFQHRHFWWLAIMFTMFVPIILPVLLWNESFWTSFVIAFMLRYLVLLHGTWLVNSAAHYYGSRPYDNNIEARESPFVILNFFGEGYHNYHHTFPYDYSTSEYGWLFNITTAFIDICAYFGLVKDRRKVEPETILKRRLRTGNLGDKELNELEQKYGSKSNKNFATQTRAVANKLQKTIDEGDESTGSIVAPLVGGRQNNSNRPLAPLSNIIHELPYISGLTSMKYTM